MSQFCGSFCAFSNRSLLTVMTYWVNAGTASAAANPPANATILKRFRTLVRMLISS
jgi:hypothetical protein